MANTSSAKKAKRAAARKRIFNLRRGKAVKDSVKDFQKLVAGKKLSDAVSKLPSVYQAIDKAAKNGTIKPNTAARMKSRLAKLAK
jgi:small subunit ribosomal protein S20